ncbi:TPA: TnsA endonuclease N-terminal domain-containing protein, partial [Escherichia coli]
LRAIGKMQFTGHVYLSQDNLKLLDKELEANFRVSVDDIKEPDPNKEVVKVRVQHPPIKIPIKRVRRNYKLVEKNDIVKGYKLGLDEVELDDYRLIHEVRNGMKMPDDVGYNKKPIRDDLSYLKVQRKFSRISLVADIARYLNKSCIEIDKIVSLTEESFEGILTLVNQFNEVLYDQVIPRLFKAIYDVNTENIEEEFEVDLVKEPPIDPGYYTVSASKDKIIRKSDIDVLDVVERSFHLDNYCFDSAPERQFFWDMLHNGKVEKIWFTGMLTHGQSDFVIHYVDSDTQRVRSYYPDFLIKKQDGSYVMIEVKGEHMIDSQNVKDKKEAAELMGVSAGIGYEIIPGKSAAIGSYGRDFLN